MVDVTIPQIGESITTVFIARWLKQPGEAVAEGDPLFEVDSDKASMEVPAPSKGVLTETLAAEGDEIDIGAVVARIDETADAPVAQAAAVEADEADAPTSEVRAGPAARQQAQKGGVDLGSVTGTGPRGRVTSDDVRSAGSGACLLYTSPSPRD